MAPGANKLVKDEMSTSFAVGVEGSWTWKPDDGKPDNSRLVIEYTSSDTSIADIDAETGIVTPYKAGSVTLTATVTNSELWTYDPVEQTITVGKGTGEIAFASRDEKAIEIIYGATVEGEDYRAETTVGESSIDYAFVDGNASTSTTKSVYASIDTTGENLMILKANADKDGEILESASKTWLVVKGVDNDDYTYTGSKAKQLMIKQANPLTTVPVIPATFTYTGSAQNLVTTAGVVATGANKIQYAVTTDGDSPTEYQDAIPTATNAGTYYVWYKVEGNDNYYEVNATSTKVTIDNVAIGSTRYTSLADAVNAASGGDTIEFLSDVVVTDAMANSVNEGVIQLTKAITIDGKNHNLIVNYAGETDLSAINIPSQSGTVAIRNLTIVGNRTGATNQSKLKHGINAYKSSNVVLTKVTVTNCLYALECHSSTVKATNLIAKDNLWGSVNAENKDGACNLTIDGPDTNLNDEAGSVNVDFGSSSNATTVILNAGSYPYRVNINDGWERYNFENAKIYSFDNSIEIGTTKDNRKTYIWVQSRDANYKWQAEQVEEL